MGNHLLALYIVVFMTAQENYVEVWIKRIKKSNKKQQIGGEAVNSDEQAKLSTGAIIGIVAGGVCCLLFIYWLISPSVEEEKISNMKIKSLQQSDLSKEKQNIINETINYYKNQDLAEIESAIEALEKNKQYKFYDDTHDILSEMSRNYEEYNELNNSFDNKKDCDTAHDNYVRNSLANLFKKTKNESLKSDITTLLGKVKGKQTICENRLKTESDLAAVDEQQKLEAANVAFRDKLRTIIRMDDDEQNRQKANRETQILENQQKALELMQQQQMNEYLASLDRATARAIGPPSVIPTASQITFDEPPQNLKKNPWMTFDNKPQNEYGVISSFTQNNTEPDQNKLDRIAKRQARYF